MKAFFSDITTQRRRLFIEQIHAMLELEGLPARYGKRPVGALLFDALQQTSESGDPSPLTSVVIQLGSNAQRADASFRYLETLEQLDFQSVLPLNDGNAQLDFYRDVLPQLNDWLRRVRRLLVDELQNSVANRQAEQLERLNNRLESGTRRVMRLQAVLNTLLSTTGDVFMIITDGNKQIRNFSRSASEVLGYTHSEVDGQPTELLHPETWVHSGALTTLRKMLATNGYWSGEVPYRRKDGETVQTIVSLMLVMGPAGEQLGTVCVGRDISEQRRMQEQLLEYTNDLQQIVEERRRDLDESEELYRLLIEDINEGYFIAKQGKFIFTNNAFDRITGYSRDELRELSFLDLIHERSQRHAKNWWKRVVSGNTVPAAELMVQRKGSSKAIVECKAQPVKLRDEPHVIGMLHNITDKKKMERQLQRYVDNLEKMVAERTAELESSIGELKSTQFQLVKSQKLAGIGILAAGVAHEINNPLQALLLKSQHILRHLDDTHQINRSTRDIIEYVNRMAEIVRGLSKYARTVKEDQDSVPVNLISVIKESLELAYHTRNFGDVIVKREFNTVQPVLGNEGQYQQIFINLIVNAIDAMEGRGTLSLRLDKDGDMVLARVTDTGCGIPAEHMDKIFTPLFTTKPSGKGTGMGLHVAYRIITEYNGDIHVKSELGKGTTFTLSFPIAKSTTSSSLKAVTD